MKNNDLQDLAIAGDLDALDQADSGSLVYTLGQLADGAPEGDTETLDAMDAVLVTLEARSDVDAPTRRWLGRIHTGILEQL